MLRLGATSSAMSKEPAPKLKLNKNDNIMNMLSTVESPKIKTDGLLPLFSSAYNPPQY